jgi:hypothetical protein
MPLWKRTGLILLRIGMAAGGSNLQTGPGPPLTGCCHQSEKAGQSVIAQRRAKTLMMAAGWRNQWMVPGHGLTGERRLECC